MPIPRPNQDENENEFVSRCISKIIDEYDQSQAAAICYNAYRDKEKMSKKEKLFVLQPKKTENRGMYLTRCSNNGKMRSQFPQLKERLGFCLTSFNEYYKYWNKIEMAEVPENSALGICIAREKAKGFDYKQAYAHCATKVGNKPLGAGGQINMNGDDDLLVEPVEFQEMNIYGYETEYFYMCPGAQETFAHLMEMGGDEETKRMVRNAAILADRVFDIEEDVVEDQIATPQDLAQVELLVSDFYSLMKVIDDKLGMKHDVSYMDGHIDVIKKYI